MAALKAGVAVETVRRPLKKTRVLTASMGSRGERSHKVSAGASGSVLVSEQKE
jgi:hypothetical protein